MTRCGRFAALLAVLSIPALLSIGVPPAVAAPFALPSLSALDIGIPAEALAGVVKALLVWSAAGFAGLAASLIRLPQARWRRMAMQPDFPLPKYQREPDRASALFLPPEVITPAPRAHVPGADLAARARFVAMSFAFPETGLSRPGPGDWPLIMNCQPTRFTLTLHHAALNYRLEFCNRGALALGPLIVRADLATAETRIAPHRPIGFAAEPLLPCHYLDNLAAGDSIAVTGELRLPLAGIAAMRLGTAELLVPLLRLCSESAGESQPALSVSACFAIGLPPLCAGGGIQPFRLDSGPGIWRKLTARRLISDDLP